MIVWFWIPSRYWLTTICRGQVDSFCKRGFFFFFFFKTSFDQCELSNFGQTPFVSKFRKAKLKCHYSFLKKCTIQSNLRLKTSVCSNIVKHYNLKSVGSDNLVVKEFASQSRNQGFKYFLCHDKVFIWNQYWLVRGRG